ncbi:MAG: GIY-YIG nuclease family protein [Thermodesulfobacteriota bacterium]|nr:GIY-YIG nuclease family protein [Thermodesulfobacteriota bacterium]
MKISSACYQERNCDELCLSKGSGSSSINFTIDRHRSSDIIFRQVAPRSFKPEALIKYQGHEIYYVGMTTQSIQTRLRQGFSAKGEHGYWGYKWQNQEFVELLVWTFPDGDKDHVEAIEAELVYYVRARTGKWPTYQMEIHFHGASEVQRQIAQSILEKCLGENQVRE